jgi:hypothetical protein
MAEDTGTSTHVRACTGGRLWPPRSRLFIRSFRGGQLGESFPGKCK